MFWVPRANDTTLTIATMSGRGQQNAKTKWPRVQCFMPVIKRFVKSLCTVLIGFCPGLVYYG